MMMMYDDRLCEHLMDDSERALYGHSMERPYVGTNGW